MAKRGSNIYRRKDGRFEGRVPIERRKDGSLRYKSVYARTLSEVKAKMAELYSANTSKVLSSGITVKEAAKQWLTSARLRVKASSYANYRSIIEKHILPELGNKHLSSITTPGLNEFIQNKLTYGRLNSCGGLSAKFVRDIMTVYRSIEAYAAMEYDISRTHFTMPKQEKHSLDVLTKDERHRLEAYLTNDLNTTNMAVLLCMFSGLRIGELCGLKWGDIDLENGTLSVKRTVQRINKGGCSEVIVGTPKSKSSVRVVPVPRFIMEILRQNKKDDRLYVITGQLKPVEPRTMQNRFKKILKDCGVRNVKFHLLRHTYATVCIEQGFDPKTLSELLGHADASITLNRYVHSSMQMKRKYVDRLQLAA